MKKIKLSEFLFYKQIFSILNISFVLNLVITNIFAFRNIVWTDIVSFRIVVTSIFAISVLFFFVYFLYFFLFFKKKYSSFIQKIYKDFKILFFSIFFTLIIGIICLILIWVFKSDIQVNPKMKLSRIIFFVFSPFSIILTFLGIAMNIKIFNLWQHQKKDDTNLQTINNDNKIEDNFIIKKDDIKNSKKENENENEKKKNY